MLDLLTPLEFDRAYPLLQSRHLLFVLLAKGTLVKGLLLSLSSPLSKRLMLLKQSLMLQEQLLMLKLLLFEPLLSVVEELVLNEAVEGAGVRKVELLNNGTRLRLLLPSSGGLRGRLGLELKRGSEGDCLDWGWWLLLLETLEHEGTQRELVQ
jgi:hypothetical protein